MKRATITIPDDLEAELEAYLGEREDGLDLDALVERALRSYLARQDRWGGREVHLPRRRPFWITPLEERDAQGEPDVSINHDRYFAEGS